jgi:hypothetical protein
MDYLHLATFDLKYDISQTICSIKCLNVCIANMKHVCFSSNSLLTTSCDGDAREISLAETGAGAENGGRK